MNSCILMAEIVQEPQLRFTPDNKEIADMLVQFPGLRAEDPPATLKVVGWGKLATEMQQNYHQGDRVVIEGRLTMSTVELQGFKEKRAELTAQRIHPLGKDVSLSPSLSSPVTASERTSTASNTSMRTPEKMEPIPSSVGVLTQTKESQPYSATPKAPEPDIDEIPF